MHNRFKKILDSYDIKDASFHACRHSFATRCIELGFDVKSLSEILGHSNVAFTMNRYVHPSMAHKAENMNMLNDLFK
jgi:integrase